MDAPGSRLEAAIERAEKELLIWVAGMMVVHATVVVGFIVCLIKLL